MGRGLSADEKRVKLLEIFHETKDFYQLKELEKLAPKMKGIVSQSVKEVLQSLVDDGMVQSDKVGSSNFFWSFPSQRGATVRDSRTDIISTQRPSQITAKVKAGRLLQQSAQTSFAELKNLIEQEKVLRPETAERTEALALLTLKNKEVAELKNELMQYGACDPTQVEVKRRAIFLAHEAAVRWTDNFSLMRSDLLKRTSADWGSLQAYLGISDVDEYEDIA